ncbi:MAG: sulfotransferase domain-containing protein [candidate division NC10 bacterium]|nr:sulfotransferase domain-containing protein [candidate division NC10 bacterium]MDE2321406.1 sulfotransferase domain-containing protein [candidate division NC10 bacterium]
MSSDPFHEIRNRLSVPACLINSLPKSGTHLLKKVVGLLPGMHPVEFHLGPERFNPATDGGTDGVPGEYPPTVIPLGVGRPRPASREEVSRALAQYVTPGRYATAHVPFSPGLALVLNELKITMVTIIRDPRDVAVSHAAYICSLPPDNPVVGTPLHRYYQSLSDGARLMTSIVGVCKEPDGPVLLSIKDRLEGVLRWESQPFNYTTRFERLVGPQGGGSRDEQLQEIRAIARHLGIDCSDREIEAVADQLFGGTGTFRRGVIGGWKAQFTDEHRQVCKKLIGRLLIDLGYEQDDNW